MNDIVWEDPPPPTNTRALGWFADELRQHPGKWAIHPSEFKSEASMRTAVGNINRGFIKAFPKGEFRATYRKSADGPGTVYVQFVGGDQ